MNLIQPRSLFGPSERQAELLTCWRKTDEQGLFDYLAHPEGRPTFTELFGMCMPGMVNVIANSDIFFDSTIHFAKPTESHCYALSRWDVNTDGGIALWDHLDSQDVWIFWGKPPEMDLTYTNAKGETKDIAPGIAGCDNRLVYLLQQAGVIVTNPSKTIKAFHLHNVQWRSYLLDPEGKARGGDKIERIPAPYGFAKPTTL